MKNILLFSTSLLIPALFVSNVSATVNQNLCSAMILEKCTGSPSCTKELNTTFSPVCNLIVEIENGDQNKFDAWFKDFNHTTRHF